MSLQELKASLSLSIVFMFRMFGLFMVLPVLTLYADDLQDSTPALIGIAIGAYGISQALLQIPFGWLSDFFGRKPMIITGLVLFSIGSVIAANAVSIQGVILGRILQGCGAIAGVITALLADLTREQHRTRSMAIFGIGIGISFCLAMIIGPPVAHHWGLSGLFFSNAILAIIGIILVLFVVPSAPCRRDLNASVSSNTILSVSKNPQLLRLMLGIFTLHFVLTGLFVFLPQEIENALKIPKEYHGWIYLVGLIGSFLAIIPIIIYSEKKRKLKQCFIGAVALLLISILLIGQIEKLHWLLLVAVIVFFAGFNFLEATLPSLASKLSPAGTRGSTMGIYSTCQFLGAALGGACTGFSYQYWGLNGVVFICATLLAIWLLFSISMKHPPYVSTMILALNPIEKELNYHQLLASIPGVEEVMILDSEKTAYLKVDNKKLDKTQLQQYAQC